MFTLERSQLTIRNNLSHIEYVFGQSRVTGIKWQFCVKVHGLSICEGCDGSVDRPLHPWPEEVWDDVARAQCQLPASAGRGELWDPQWQCRWRRQSLRDLISS